MVRILGFDDPNTPLIPGYLSSIWLLVDHGTTCFGLMVVVVEILVFSTWMAFGGNTRDFSSFGEETDEIMDLHQILEEVLLTEHGDGVTSIKRRRRDLFRDENPIRTLGDYSKPSHDGYRNTIELLVGNNVVPLISNTIRLVQNECSFHRLRSEDPNQHLKDFLKLVDSLDLDDENRERTQDLALYDNESWNDPRDFSKSVKAIVLPQDVRNTSYRRLIELENRVQRLMEAQLALTQPTQVNKITTSCEICSGPHDTQYCMEDPEQAIVEYASTRTNETASRPFTMNQGPRRFNKAIDAWKERPNFNSAHAQTFANPQNGLLSTYSSNHQTKLEKALVDFDSRQEKRLSSLRTQFGQHQDDMKSLMTLPFDNETEEESSVEPSKTGYTNHEEADDTVEEVESEKVVEEETKGEPREEKEDDPEHFDTFPTMKDLRLHYNWIMRKRLEPRTKPSKLKKNCNFVGRVKGLKVFVGNFTYECDFMVLEDTTSVIDHYLGSVVFGKPFVKTTRLVYNKEEGTVVFERDKEKISDDDNFEKTHYSDSLDLGPEYKYDEKFLIKNEKEIFTDDGDGVRIYPDGIASPAMLYLMRRSLEVLRKFHWIILEGRFNHLSNVSPPLLSKPGEY
nr:MAK10-like protein [Tanacetum cinerariifolium]